MRIDVNRRTEAWRWRIDRAEICIKRAAIKKWIVFLVIPRENKGRVLVVEEIDCFHESARFVTK